jgi:hypothetical protein
VMLICHFGSNTKLAGTFRRIIFCKRFGGWEARGDAYIPVTRPVEFPP